MRELPDHPGLAQYEKDQIEAQERELERDILRKHFWTMTVIELDEEIDKHKQNILFRRTIAEAMGVAVPKISDRNSTALSLSSMLDDVIEGLIALEETGDD